MEIEIDGVKYRIIPIPPSLSPYSTLISDLLKKKPASFEEAEQDSEQIAKAMEKLLAGTVEPPPRKEHHIQLFNAIVDLTNRILEAAGLFRQNPESNTAESYGISLHPSPETKQDSPP